MLGGYPLRRPNRHQVQNKPRGRMHGARRKPKPKTRAPTRMIDVESYAETYRQIIRLVAKIKI